MPANAIALRTITTGDGDEYWRADDIIAFCTSILVDCDTEDKRQVMSYVVRNLLKAKK